MCASFILQKKKGETVKNKTLTGMVRYANKKYPYPKRCYSKLHYERRCTQIFTSEEIIKRCMESPFKAPVDVIYDYIIELEWMMKDITSDSTKRTFNTMVETATILYNYFKEN